MRREASPPATDGDEAPQGFSVARLHGEIDIANAAAIGVELTDSVANSAAGVVVDLSDVDYLDSAGMRLLFELAARLNRRQQELRVVVPEGSMLESSLSVARLTDVVPLFPTVAEALGQS
jgi:anti-sigma B factor antagonist